MIRGRAWKFGDNINTNVMTHHGREHCLEEVNPEFTKNQEPGDIIVAGTNFGAGSAREIAPRYIKEREVGLIIAKSFARLFLRNAINIGLPIMECPEVVDSINDGDILEVDTSTGKIKNVTTKAEHTALPFSPIIQEIIAAGGLINYAKKRLGTA